MLIFPLAANAHKRCADDSPVDRATYLPCGRFTVCFMFSYQLLGITFIHVGHSLRGSEGSGWRKGSVFDIHDPVTSVAFQRIYTLRE
jgi:hypothetical protein